MAHLTLELLAPEDGAAPTETRGRCVELVALLRCAHRDLLRFQARFDGGEAVSVALAYQLREALEDSNWHLGIGKQGAVPAAWEFLQECAAEVRHRPCSFFLEAQLVSSLPPPLVALATGLLQFRRASLADFRRVQELFCEFRGVPFDRIAAQPRGAAYGAFRRATDPRFSAQAQPRTIRPSAVWAGGETVSAVPEPPERAGT